MIMRIFVAASLCFLLTACAQTQSAKPLTPEYIPAKQPEKQVIRKYFHLTPQQQESAKAAVIGRLKDPESARFASIVGIGDPEGTGKYAVCGTVNAKNSYGGYTGSRMFAVIDNSNVLFWSESKKAFDNEMILLICKPNNK